MPIVTSTPPFAGTQIGDKTIMANQMPGLTNEAKINAATVRAVEIGALYVYISANMLPYNVTLVTNLAAFSATGGRLIREGGNATDFDVKAYGAAGDAITDDAPALQAAVTAAFNVPGGTVGFPPFPYRTTVPFSTPTDVAGAITLRGYGRPRGFTGGNSGEPVARQGATIVYTGTTGDIFSATLSSGNKRQHITIDNISFEGNPIGVSGHGLHFTAAGATFGILPVLRDVTVTNCKQHGIFFDGLVFESLWHNVRIYQCGDRGFKAAANGAGAPGEVRVYGAIINANAYGVDVAGGGIFSFFGLSLNGNTNEGLLVNGSQVNCFDINFELNGTIAGSQATITGANGTQFIGITINTKVGGTGNGLSFVNCLWASIHKLNANSSVAGGGYMDIRFDNGTSRCTVENYTPDDFIDRISLGTGGGHLLHRGRSWQSGQSHGVTAQSISTSVAVIPNALTSDKFQLTCTGAGGITPTINNPTIASGGNYHDGQIFVVEVFNNTAGAITVNWQAQWHLAGAWVNPAAGMTRTITFSWNVTRGGFFEISRSAADIT